MSTTPPPPPPPPPPSPPPPSSPTPAAPLTPRKVWWKRWWGIALIAFGVLIIIGLIIGDAPVDDDPAAAPASEPSTEPDPDPTDSEPDPDPTTEPEPEPEPAEPEPTTEQYELTEDDLRTAVFPVVFQSSREGIIELLRDHSLIQSVDQYIYDADTGTVVVSLTPEFDFDEGVRDDAWEIMRIFTGVYTTDAWLHPEFEWAPTLDVEISTARYRCSGEVMRLLADARLPRSEWEAQCRVN